MVVGALVVVVVLLVAGGLFWADRQINPGGKPGAVVTGPAVILEDGTTTIVPSGRIAWIGADNEIVIEGSST